MNGIKFKGYKAFSDDWISIENFPNITVLIGRNNSGKSSCIDVIESLTNPIVYKQCQELGLDVIMEHNLTEEEVKSVFPESTYGGGIPANNFWEFGKNFIGERVAFDVGVQSRYIGETVTYSAQWAVDENGNDKPDNDEKYTVSYQFINGADDKELPKEVNDMLPKATSYVYGVKVVPVALKADRVETTDGVWLFEGWTPEEIEKLTADTAFTGTWTFAKNAGGINHIPVITAEDKTLTVGDSFDVMAGVTALDKEDGDLTDKIEVINNTVDTSKAGTYTVTYKVTDSNGASVTKTITITVKDKDKEEQPTAPTKPDKGDNNVNDKNNTASKADKPDTAVKTGDSTNVLLWSMATIISLTGVITALIFKRRRSR